ncbi:MAG TPA: flagellar biosynthesis regulator FlaF [Caulobacteraceae bacterium]|jgi:flagellar protein FlaF|nr:flagellar biosynthesis regulator FlaF [Caulobacteraceae bacterium]
MSLRAYQQAATRSESPRDTEYRLFGQVTRALMDAAATPHDLAKRVDALDWNRRLWSTLAADCAQPENRLSSDVRAQIISLSMWVGRHTSAIVRREEGFEALIDLNRTMMQGLATKNVAA